ncbi:MAG: hypothetical protein R3A47_03580 [Polyangiales bacterium]
MLHVDANDVFYPKIERAMFLLPWADEDPIVLDVLKQADKWLPLKAHSKLYRYNSMVLPILRHRFFPARIDDDGYQPSHERRRQSDDDREFLDRESANQPKELASPAQGLEMIKRFIDQANTAGVETLLVTTPMNRNDVNLDTNSLIDPMRRESKRLLIDFAEKHHLVYRSYDEAAYPVFRDASLFIDTSHLNEKGAEAFSRIFVRDLLDRAHGSKDTRR